MISFHFGLTLARSLELGIDRAKGTGLNTNFFLHCIFPAKPPGFPSRRENPLLLECFGDIEFLFGAIPLAMSFFLVHKNRYITG